jgi:hypothetical protein
MFDRASALSGKACFIGLFTALFLAVFFAFEADWLSAIACTVILSPVIVLFGSVVIGPVSLVVGIATGVIASAAAAIHRVARP